MKKMYTTVAMYFPIILGTARQNRRSEHAAKFVFETVKKAGLDSDLIDVRDFRIPATDNTETSETAKRFEKILVASNGLIIVAPEYNHGYPGELKMMLDLLYVQFHRKPAGICGVSSGVYGGMRMIVQLRQVLIGLKMVPLNASVTFSNVKTLFGKDGSITNVDQKAALEKSILVMLEELKWYGEKLRQ